MPSDGDIALRTVWDMTAVVTHHARRSSFFIIYDEDFFVVFEILGDTLGRKFRKRSRELTSHIHEEYILGSLGVLGEVHCMVVSEVRRVG